MMNGIQMIGKEIFGRWVMCLEMNLETFGILSITTSFL